MTNFVDLVNSGKLLDEYDNPLSFYDVATECKDSFFTCLSIRLYNIASKRKDLRVKTLLMFAKMVWDTEFADIQEVLNLGARTPLNARCFKYTTIQVWVFRMSLSNHQIDGNAASFIDKHPSFFVECALRFIEYNAVEGRIQCKFTFISLCAETFNVKTQLYHVYFGQVIHTQWIYPRENALPVLDMNMDDVSLDIREDDGMPSFIIYHANNRFYLLIPQARRRTKSLQQVHPMYVLRAYCDNTRENVKVLEFGTPQKNGDRVHTVRFAPDSPYVSDGRTYGIYPAEAGRRLFRPFTEGDTMYVYALKRLNGHTVAVLQSVLDQNDSYPFFLIEPNWRGVAVLLSKTREEADRRIAKELSILVKCFD